jgi:hypothetical protein
MSRTGSAGLSPQALGGFRIYFRRHAGVKHECSDYYNALLVGNMNSGSANNYGTNTYFWSSSSNSGTNAWNRNLNSSNSGANRNNNNKSNLFSVRCKKWKSVIVFLLFLKYTLHTITHSVSIKK